ncbi:hypothetical protein ALI144C_00610 [Actinosynnema sp. ALI-1.44]|uniref:S8 family peptidase n=1 Tax=Actinosynnema sp. ALI-1.44 TaxID=1933779 RepID=UPI00097C8059|nr:S8 family serine peptidase [Actinosynnema sp. ALI-1.44]ONI91777.1 hypothetical protein ALI144C_00610 [Actinosynnema sp. ALI-1.44]
MAIGLLLTMGLLVPPGAANAAPPPGESPAPDTVTLITGDKVTLNGKNAARVTPAKGREGTTFTQRVDEFGDVHVVPVDVNGMLRTHRMDPRLFNVTKLVRYGYGDAARPDIPLIVSGPAAGAAKVMDLPGIQGAAVRVDKATGLRAFSSAQRIWLDGPVVAMLDKSVPQIGAPEAWKAGYKGKNTTVAVLDTGIDATHPDLAGAVVDAKNFTRSEHGADDYQGHGTHVASIITGQNAKYEGVAPDTSLLNGKVLDDHGVGSESSIIAGMQWAADKGANVVNMSLGSPMPSDGTDPLSTALNAITAKTGTLFVVAAGNEAAQPGHPGAADAALTVGAVDHDDQLAPFSNRGPRLGDNAIKPDITAPGVNIAAAKAAHGTIGTPVDDTHVRLSGTSMATPHVAGAAAILAGEHPGWKADQLKSALMSSAKPTAGLSVFEQGAGRVDVAKAVTQNVYASPGSLSAGVAQWPHNDDTPITKTVTYHNSGTAPVTLNLTADVRDPAGKPAPAGMFTVAPATLTVPAGGQADATVTTDTRINGPDGIYSGVVLAGALRTPVTVTREVESYEVTVNVVGFDGAPSNDHYVEFTDIDRARTVIKSDPSGTFVLRLPKGRFHLNSWISRDKHATAVIDEPEYLVTANSTLTLDARDGKPVSFEVDRPDARTGQVTLTFERKTSTPDGSRAYYHNANVTTFYVRPSKTTAPADQFRYTAEGLLAQQDANGSFDASPYLYHVHTETHGKVPDNLVTKATTSQLAKVRSEHATTTAATRYGVRDSMISKPLPYSLDEYYTPDVPWTGTFMQSENPDGYPAESEQYEYVPRTFELGQPATVRWNYGVFGPGFAVPYDRSAHRLGNEVSLLLGLFTDQGTGRVGWAPGTGTTELSRDGTRIGVIEGPAVGRLTVPAGPATYRLHTEFAPAHSMSTKVTADWTFASDTVPGNKPKALPLMAVKFAPSGLDGHNRAARALPTIVPVSVDHNSGGTAKAPAVQVSHDRGKTWKAVPLRTFGGKWYVVLSHPADAKSVSLKATAKDAEGNGVEQTVVDAFLLK